ncbi:MAG: helix-turn-helix domain-containing protein [Candidatus Levybacteria bacterium]|nr:helix-turn-helix domain-containing protein [Candidatus Levybacteria bacterium]
MIRAGERLYEGRIKKGLTLDEVAKATKIRISFLSAIEKGEYKKLPSSTYAHGFVRNYAQFLGLPENELLALFKREYDEEKFVKVLPEGFARKEDFPLKKIKLTRTFKILFLILSILLFYIIFQYRSAIFNPPLSVSFPKDNSIVSSQTITVTGKTDSNSAVFVNNETASVDKDGKFTKTITVFPGEVKIVIKAVNNFGKTTVVERQIEVK